jgi:hypothetical protein
MVFLREVQYQMEAFSCQHWEQYISKWNYEISVVQEINFSRLEPQRWSLELVIFGIDFRGTLYMSNVDFFVLTGPK